MISRRRTSVHFSAAITAGLWSARAWAAGPTCNGPEFLLAGEPASSWSSAISVVESRLQRSGDLDRCAHLVLEPVGGGVIVTVVTEDHRSAFRRVDRPGELLDAVEALLVVPPGPPAGEPVTPAAESAPEPDAPNAPTLADAPRPSTPPAGVEIGGGGVGRVAGAPLYVGAGATGFAQLVFDRLLIGVSMRWELVDRTVREPAPAGFGMQTYAIGVGVGRRLSMGALSLDLAIGPEVVAETQQMNAPGGGMDGRNESDVRLSLLARLSMPHEGRTRLYAAADVEGSASKLTSASPSDGGYPPLPGWSGGLTFGVAWGTAPEAR